MNRPSGFGNSLSSLEAFFVTQALMLYMMPAKPSAMNKKTCKMDGQEVGTLQHNILCLPLGEWYEPCKCDDYKCHAKMQASNEISLRLVGHHLNSEVWLKNLRQHNRRLGVACWLIARHRLGIGVLHILTDSSLCWSIFIVLSDIDSTLSLPFLRAWPHGIPVTAHFLTLTAMPDQFTNASIFFACLARSVADRVAAHMSSAYADTVMVWSACRLLLRQPHS